jgi:enoyl-[acyl-carrier protein] reductase I
MPQLLEGKTALILGIANKWSIAYAIAQAFRREGAKLLLTYQGDRLKQTVEDLGAELGATRVFDCDVSKDEDLARLTDTVRESGALHTVVHSIGFANREDLDRPISETSRAGYSLALDISAYSMLAVARATAPLMTEGGSMITLSYLGATRVLTNYNVMGVAKAALESSVRYLASELGEKKIRVNAISAGPIKTAAARGIKDFTKMYQAVAERAPLKRATDPAEVADAAVFLASGLGRGVTGDVMFVDAGYHIMGL